MKYKEKAIIDINEIIYSKKSNLSKRDLDTLIKLREAIRNESSKKGFKKLIIYFAEFIGIEFE